MGMNVGSGAKKHRVEPAINVTPLVDVVLVVLIIFMLVTPMITKTFWLNLPKKDDARLEKPQPDADQALVMTVDKAGVIRVNKTVVERSELSTQLPRMLAAKDKKVLYFDAADELPYGAAVAVMDLSRAGGARSIAILTEKVVK